MGRFIKILFYIILILVAPIISFATYIDFSTLKPAFEKKSEVASSFLGTSSGFAATFFPSSDVNFCWDDKDGLDFSFPIWADNLDNIFLYGGLPGYEIKGNCQGLPPGPRQISVWNNRSRQSQRLELSPSGVSVVPVPTTMLLIGAALIGLVGFRRRNLFKKA